MGLREMFKLVREVYPVEYGAKLSLHFHDAMNSGIEFRADGQEKPVAFVSVVWSATPEDAFARHIAVKARDLATRAREDSDAAAKRATSLAATAARLEARAAELEAEASARTAVPYQDKVGAP